MSLLQEPIRTCIPYTVREGRVLLLLWRASLATVHQSAEFWGDIVCLQREEDQTPMHAVARVVSQATRGGFHNQHPPEALEQRDSQQIQSDIAASGKRLLWLQQKNKGVSLLAGAPGRLICCLPVPYREAGLLNRVVTGQGRAVWTDAAALVRELKTEKPSIEIQGQEFLEGSEEQEQEQPLAGLPMSLTVVAALRHPVSLDTLMELIQSHDKLSDLEAAYEPSAADLLEQLELKDDDQNDQDEQQPSSGPEEVRYVCRRCTAVLFLQSEITDHKQLQSAGAVKFAGKSWQPDKRAEECNSYFLTDTSKCAELLNKMSGKIHCPGCATRLGNFNWSGGQCSCGKWVTPYIQIPKNRVDPKGLQLRLASVALPPQIPQQQQQQEQPEQATQEQEEQKQQPEPEASSAAAVSAEPAPQPQVAAAAAPARQGLGAVVMAPGVVRRPVVRPTIRKQ